jgi:hypothetical protein
MAHGACSPMREAKHDMCRYWTCIYGNRGTFLVNCPLEYVVSGLMIASWPIKMRPMVGHDDLCECENENSPSFLS